MPYTELAKPTVPTDFTVHYSVHPSRCWRTSAKNQTLSAGSDGKITRSELPDRDLPLSCLESTEPTESVSRTLSLEQVNVLARFVASSGTTRIPSGDVGGMAFDADSYLAGIRIGSRERSWHWSTQPDALYAEHMNQLRDLLEELWQACAPI